MRKNDKYLADYQALTPADWRKFWSLIEVMPNGCWRWTRGLSGNEMRFYATRRGTEQTTSTNRLNPKKMMWFYMTGETPAERQMGHTCGALDCVRFTHITDGRSGLPGDVLHEELRRRVAAGETQSSLAREYDVSGTTMWRIINGLGSYAT